MNKDICVGILLIIEGIVVFIWTIKTWTPGDDLFTNNAKGLIVSVASVIGGIMLLIGKLHF